MNQILLFLADYCSFLFQPDRYRFVDSHVDEDFGNAFVILESKTVRLRFSCERDRLLLEFQPINNRLPEWFSLGILRAVLVGDRGGSEILDEHWAAFLSESLAKLEEWCSDPIRTNEIITKFHNEEKRRAKELFEKQK